MLAQFLASSPFVQPSCQSLEHFCQPQRRELQTRSMHKHLSLCAPLPPASACIHPHQRALKQPAQYLLPCNPTSEHSRTQAHGLSASGRLACGPGWQLSYPVLSSASLRAGLTTAWRMPYDKQGSDCNPSPVAKPSPSCKSPSPSPSPCKTPSPVAKPSPSPCKVPSPVAKPCTPSPVAKPSPKPCDPSPSPKPW